MKIYNNYDDLYSKCKACKGRGHLTVSCPSLNLNLNKERVLSKFNHVDPQKRKIYERKKKKNFCGLKDINLIQMNVLKIRDEYFVEEVKELSRENTSDSQVCIESERNDNVYKDMMVDQNSKNLSFHENSDKVNTNPISTDHLIPPLSLNNLLEIESEIPKFKRELSNLARQQSKERDGLFNQNFQNKKNERIAHQIILHEKMLSFNTMRDEKNNEHRNGKFEKFEKNKSSEIVFSLKAAIGSKKFLSFNNSFKKTMNERNERNLSIRNHNYVTGALEVRLIRIKIFKKKNHQ